VRWLALAAFAGLVGGLIVIEGLTAGVDQHARGRAAPELPTQVLVPPRATIKSLHGKPAVIHFWASWCDPCRSEAPEVARLSGVLGTRARLVGVDWNDSAGGARSFIQRHRWRFRNLRDASGTTGDRFRLAGLPTTFVLDARGRIRATLHGPQTIASIRHVLRQLFG
jgi:cytochrome c biogenesis protein CcmG/thiol:disulfide interchange protein DsbE